MLKYEINKYMKKIFTQKFIQHLSKLSSIPISKKENSYLLNAFKETLDKISNLNSVNVKKIPTTHQVTGIKNVLRKDKVIEQNMFSQKQALANAHKTHKGFFVVPRIIEK